MKDACLTRRECGIKLAMKKWIGAFLVVASALIAQAQGDTSWESVSFFAVERARLSPVVAGDLPPLPTTPLIPPLGESTLAPALTPGSLTTTLAPIPEPGSMQFITVGLGLLAFRRFALCGRS